MAPKRFGRYRIQSEIGDGAMGRVYRAFDPLVRRVVAIKTVKSEYLTRSTRDEYLRRFQGEAQAAGRLSHPNIVSIFDVGEDYIVMEFLEGRTLADLLEHRKGLDLEEALEILTPVADAIDYAHKAGVIHRDIKPGNIMVLPDGRPKLMDFGVARLDAGAISGAEQYFGSPSYMAPEQIRSGEVADRSDLFSFGVVAYEAVTAQRPFQGDSITAIVYRVVNEDAPPPRSWNPDLPQSYDAIFGRALDKEPGRRFPTALSFMAALRGVDTAPAPLSQGDIAPAAPGPQTAQDGSRRPAGTDTVPVAPLAPPRPAGRWRRWTIAATILAALALAAGLPLLRRPTPERPGGGPAPGYGELRIETEPGGASVWLDGALAGQSPLSLKRLAPGAHQLQVLREGYAPAELGLEIADGMATPPLHFVMAPTGAFLRIRSLPEGATVRVDGRVVPSAALESLLLSPGPHEVQLEGKGFLPRVQRLEARAGEALVVDARLEPARTLRTGEPSRAASPPPAPTPVARTAPVELDGSVTPPRRISGDPALYPEAARRLKLTGSVIVEMTVAETGEPRDVRIVESAGAILDEAVRGAVEGWRFEPARKDGVKVRVRWRYKQSFVP